MLRLLHLGALGLANLATLASLGLATYITASLSDHSASPAASTTFALATSAISLVVLAPIFVMSAMRASYFITRVGAQLCALVLLWVLWLAVGAAIAATGITTVDCSASPAKLFHSIPFPSSGSPYGGPSGSPYGGPSGSPYGGPSGSPYGGPSGSPYGGPYGSPFGRRDGPLTLDDLADVCRETQAIEGLAFANFLLLKLTIVGLIVVGVKHRAWSTPVHEIGMQQRRKDIYPMIPGPPMSTGHSYEPLMQPSRV